MFVPYICGYDLFITDILVYINMLNILFSMITRIGPRLYPEEKPVPQEEPPVSFALVNIVCYLKL